jgi:hypothetical protein
VKEVKKRVGADILFHVLTATSGIAGSGAGKPFTGKIVAVNEDNGRVNVMAWDANGNSFARQDVPLMQAGEAHPGGDYAVFADEDVDPKKAAKAMPQGQPKDGEQVKAESTRIADGGPASVPLAKQTGDASTNPDNTAAAHMSEAMRSEGRSEGNPTVGGLTPKINPDTVGELPERERELLDQAEQGAKNVSGQTAKIAESIEQRDENAAKEFKASQDAQKTADPAAQNPASQHELPKAAKKAAAAPAKKAAAPKAPAKKSSR